MLSDVKAHFVSAFPEHTELAEGKEVKFVCKMSDSDVGVQWLKNNRPIPKDERYEILAEGATRTLLIRSALPTDSGVYACATADGRNKTEGDLVVNGS